MPDTQFLFIELADDALTDGHAFDGVAFGKFTDMHGREVELKADDAESYVKNTQSAIEATRAESGELVGLPIDATGHEKGDGAGWIVGAELVEGVIRLLPKWTEIGRELISKGIRRFFSATIDISNKVVLGGTLTNWPATRDKNNRVMLRPIELESSFYTIDESEQEPDEPAPLDISGDNDMADEKEVTQEEPEVIEQPESQPDETDNVMPAREYAELLRDFADSGKKEPHELAKDVLKKAERLAKQRVGEMLKSREHDWQIADLAADFISGNKYGLPVDSIDLSNFLGSLNEEQFEVAKVMFERITKNGLVEFQEIGHGRRILKKQLPEVYHSFLSEAVSAGNTVEQYFAAMPELGNPSEYDLSQFEGGK